MTKELTYVTLQNTSAVDQYCFVPGDEIRYTIPANSVIQVEDRVANEFIKQRGQFVVVYQPISIPERPAEGSVWVANMTGNPLAPHTVKNGKGDSIDNPLRKPEVLEYMLRPDEIETIGQDGRSVIHSPPVPVRISPFTRVRVPTSIAVWLQTRDSAQSKECVGRISICPAPSAFEPDQTWDYDDLRAYSVLVTDKIDVYNVFPSSASLSSEDEKYRARQRLLEALHFVVCDKRSSLPTREYFNENKQSILSKINGFQAKVEKKSKQTEAVK